MNARANDALKVYIDRLRGGTTERFDLQVDAVELGLVDGQWSFKDSVSIDGQVYLANGELIVQMDLSAGLTMPCKVCNEGTDVEIKLAKLYHVQSVREIPSGVLDLSDLIREQILLEAPQFAECGEGSCPTRAEISKYMVSDQ